MSNILKGIINEGISAQDLADVLYDRLTMRYPDVVSRYGHEVVGDIISDVASFHEGAEELGTSDIGGMIREIIRKLENYNIDEAVDPAQQTVYMQVKGLVDQLDKRGKQNVAKALKKNLGIVTEEEEVDYDDPKWDAMVKRVGQLAKQGERKVVYDPEKRVYKTVPVNPPKDQGAAEEQLDEKWSQKYKNSINCSHPKGFSQRAHCAGKKKHNESVEMEMVCEDCGMCETHADHQNLDEACWKGYHKEGNKKMFGKTYPNCVKNEGAAEGLNEFAPNDDGGEDRDHEYEVYQCNPDDQFDWIGGPIYKTDDMGKAHDIAYKLNKKYPNKAFMIWQERSQGSRGGYGIKDEQGVAEEKCPHCSGPMFSELMINEKKDACYYKVKSRYKVWPSAYASGALVKCRKKGASNWGNKSEGVAEGFFGIDDKIKGKIQNIVSRLSDEYGMWDHKAQTFTPDGLEHLKSILKFNDKYIKYALSLTSRDFEAEGVAEGSLNEFAPDDGGEEDNLRKYAKIWYNGNDSTRLKVEQILDGMGWEIGPLESEEGGCFVVQADDEDGDTYIGFTPEELSEQLDENLRQWFKEKWVRFGPDGKIRGACARGDDSEGKPKCLPQSKAHSLGKKGRASAAARKRREDPNPERHGKAINVNTKKKTSEGVAEEFELAGVDVAYELGRKAYKQGMTIRDNPYSATKEARKYDEWEKGLRRGKEDAFVARHFRNSMSVKETKSNILKGLM